MVCPHAVIRMKVYDPALLEERPRLLQVRRRQGQGVRGNEVHPPGLLPGLHRVRRLRERLPRVQEGQRREDGQEGNQHGAAAPLQDQEAKNFEFFLSLPEVDPKLIKRNTIKGSQLIQPLFEFSGACAGCGETPYVKLMSQLYGDRAVIANATGCTSIYGGNLPTTPTRTRKDGRGPSWSNSLFEDAAEFGFGMRLTSDKLFEFANELIDAIIAAGKSAVSKDLLQQIRTADQSTQEGIESAERPRGGAEEGPGKGVHGRREAPARGGRLPDQEVGVDPRRRRLGIRHRLRRPGSRHRLGPQGEHPRPGHARCTPTRAGRCPRRRPSGAIAKFAAGGKAAWARRTSA